MINLPKLDADTIRQYEKEYVLTPWTVQMGLNPLVADRAKGNYSYDKDGRKYTGWLMKGVMGRILKIWFRVIR